jgi:hypothetical protein
MHPTRHILPCLIVAGKGEPAETQSSRVTIQAALQTTTPRRLLNLRCINLPIPPEKSMKQKLRKKILTYLIVALGIFLLILFVGVLFIDFSWSESALLSAFLTIIGVGGYWWKEEGLG